MQEHDFQAGFDDWFEDTPTPSCETQEDDERPLPRDTLRLSRPFPGIKELKAGRTDFFAELAEVVNLEVQRLLRYTMMTYAQPRSLEIEIKAEADVQRATKDIMKRVVEYIDKCVQMLEESKDGSTVKLNKDTEVSVLVKQLDESIAQNQDLLGKMSFQESRIKKLNSMIKSMRVQYYKEIESQKDQFRNIIHRYLPELSPDEMQELLQSVAAVRLFNAGDYIDEDTQLAVQQKVQAVEKDFNIEREALMSQIQIITESEAEARHKCALAIRRGEKLQYELSKLTGARKAPSAPTEQSQNSEMPATPNSQAGGSFESPSARPSFLETDMSFQARGSVTNSSAFGARRGSDFSRGDLKKMMEKVHDTEKRESELLMQVQATNDLVNKQKAWLESLPNTGEVSVLRVMMGDILTKTGSMQTQLQGEVKEPALPEKKKIEENMRKEAAVNDVKLLEAEKELLKSENGVIKDEITKLTGKNAELESHLEKIKENLSVTEKELKKKTNTVEGLMEVEAPKTQTLKHANTTLRILKMLKWDKQSAGEEATKIEEMKSFCPQSIDETISELVMDEARRFTVDYDGLKRELEKAHKEVDKLKDEKESLKQANTSLQALNASQEVATSTDASGSASGAYPSSPMANPSTPHSAVGTQRMDETQDSSSSHDYSDGGKKKAVKWISGDQDESRPTKEASIQTWRPKRRDESIMAYPDRSEAGCQAGQPKGRKRNGPHDYHAVLEWENPKDFKRGIEFAMHEAQESEIRDLKAEVRRLEELLEQAGPNRASSKEPRWWDEDANQHAERVHKEADRRRSARLSSKELAEMSPLQEPEAFDPNADKVLKKNSTKAANMTSLSVILDEVVPKANLEGGDGFDVFGDMDLASAEEAARREEQMLTEANTLIHDAASALENLESEINGEDVPGTEAGMTPAQRSAYRVEQAKAMLKQAEVQMAQLSSSNNHLSHWKTAKTNVYVHQKLKNELRVEYESCLVKKLNEERSRIYRAWPRTTSAEPTVRKKVHETLGSRKTLDLEVALAETHVMDQRNEALARIDLARLITYGRESHLHLCANDARFEDLRDLLESQELFSHYECIGSLSRRLMACRGEFKRMRSRLAGALFESDRLRAELCLLREDFVKDKENASICWARHTHWLRRCLHELGDKGPKLKIPQELLERYINKDSSKVVLQQELANNGMAAGQAGEWEYTKRINRRRERVEKRVISDCRHMMLEHQRRAFSMADALFVFHKIQEDEPGSRHVQSIMDLPDVQKIITDVKQLSGAAQQLKLRLKAVDASEKTFLQKAPVILDIMDKVETRERKTLENYKESFDLEPTDGPPRRQLEETLEMAVKACKWLDIAEYRCSEGEVEAANKEVDDSTDDEGSNRYKDFQERAEEVRKNVAQNVVEQLSRARKRYSSVGIDDEMGLGGVEGYGVGSGRGPPPSKNISDVRRVVTNKMLLKREKQGRLRGMFEAARQKAKKPEELEKDRKAKEAAKMLSRLEAMEAAEKALEMDTDDRGLAIAYMETDKRAAILAALPLAIAAMPSKKRKTLRDAYNVQKEGEPAADTSDEEEDAEDPDQNMEDLLKAWGISSDTESEEEVADDAAGGDQAASQPEGESKNTGWGAIGAVAKLKKKILRGKPRENPFELLNVRARSNDGSRDNSRPGTKGSGNSKGSQQGMLETPAMQAAIEEHEAVKAAESRVATLEERMAKMQALMQEDLNRESEAKLMKEKEREMAEAKVKQLELEISTLRSVMEAGQAKQEAAEAAEAAALEGSDDLESDASSSEGPPGEHEPRERRRRKRRRHREREAPEGASPIESEYEDDYSETVTESEEEDKDPKEGNRAEDDRAKRPREKKPRERRRRPKPDKSEQSEVVPRKVTTPRSERLPTIENDEYSGEDETSFFNDEEEGEKEPVAENVDSMASSPRKDGQQKPKRERKRREPREKKQKEKREREPQASEVEGTDEDEYDEEDEEESDNSFSQSGEDESDVSPAAQPERKRRGTGGDELKRLISKSPQPSTGDVRTGASPQPSYQCQCRNCGALVDISGAGMEIRVSPATSPAPSNLGKEGIAKMKGKVALGMMQKKSTLENLTKVMDTAMRQSKEILYDSSDGNVLAAVLEAQAQAVAEVAQAQIEKTDQDLDVPRDLRARKAANRLEQLSAKEAAKEALNMEEEERGDAIGYMQADKRKMLLAALPEVIQQMSEAERDQLIGKASGPEDDNVAGVVRLITQQAFQANKREQGIPAPVRQTLGNISSLANTCKATLQHAKTLTPAALEQGTEAAGVKSDVAGAERSAGGPSASSPEDADEGQLNAFAFDFDGPRGNVKSTSGSATSAYDSNRSETYHVHGEPVDVQQSDRGKPPSRRSELPPDDAAQLDEDLSLAGQGLKGQKRTMLQVDGDDGVSRSPSGSPAPTAASPVQDIIESKKSIAKPRPPIRARPVAKTRATQEVDPEVQPGDQENLAGNPGGLSPGHPAHFHRRHSRSMKSLASDKKEESPEAEAEPETEEVEVQCNMQGIPWAELPEHFVQWIKENLVLREQAEFYCTPKSVTELQWFDLNIIQREKIFEDFEIFLKEIMERMQPVRKRKKKGDADATGEKRNGAASPQHNLKRGKSPKGRRSPLNEQPFDEAAYDPYNWESTHRSLAQLQIDPTLAWLSVGGNRLMQISGPMEPLQAAASETKPKHYPYPFFVQLDANGVPLQKLPAVVSGRAPLEPILGTTSREMDNHQDGYIAVPEGAVVLLAPGTQYQTMKMPVRNLEEASQSPENKDTDAENSEAVAEGDEADKTKEGENETEKEKELEEGEGKKEKPKPSPSETRPALQQLVSILENYRERNARSCFERMKPPTVLPRRRDSTEANKARSNPNMRNPWRGRHLVTSGNGKQPSTGPAQPADQYVGCVSWSYRRQEPQPAAEPEPEAPVVQQTQVKEPWTQAKAENLIRSLVSKEKGNKKLVDARQPGLPNFWPQPRKGAVGAKMEDTEKIATAEELSRLHTLQPAAKKPTGAGTPNVSGGPSPMPVTVGSEGSQSENTDNGIALSGPLAAGWTSEVEGFEKASLPQIVTPRYGDDVKKPVRNLKTSREGGRWGGSG